MNKFVCLLLVNNQKFITNPLNHPVLLKKIYKYYFKRIERYMNLLKQSKYDCFLINNIPEKYRTKQLCLEAVKRCSRALQYVPEHLKTPELCLEFLKQGGIVLEYIPEHLKTLEVCLEAVKQDYGELRYIPEPLKTYEL